MGDTISIDSGIELRGDEQFDAATYVASAIFNSAAYPPGMPDYLIRHIEAQASFAQRLDDAGMTIGGANGGPIGEATKSERTKKANEEIAEYLDMMSEKFEREERERQEWSRTVSTVAGVSMTGKEWAQFAERLRTDDKLHREMVELFIQRGMSRDDAESRYDRLQRVAEIAAIPPNQRTDEQKKVIADANADPSLKRDVSDVTALMDKKSSSSPSMTGDFAGATAGVPAAPTGDATGKPAPKVATVEVTGPGF